MEGSPPIQLKFLSHPVFVAVDRLLSPTSVSVRTSEQLLLMRLPFRFCFSPSQLQLELNWREGFEAKFVRDSIPEKYEKNSLIYFLLTGNARVKLKFIMFVLS